MTPDPFPPDLPDLERWLTRRPCPEPGAGLRDRILAAARIEHRRPARGLAWRAAAAVVLALNVALSAANGLRYQALPVRVAVAPVAETPDVPEPLTAIAVARLMPAPDVEAVARRFFEYQEN